MGRTHGWISPGLKEKGFAEDRNVEAMWYAVAA
jgi:hypothetical protein